MEVSGKFLEKFRKEPLGQGQEYSKKRKKEECGLFFKVLEHSKVYAFYLILFFQLFHWLGNL